MPPETHRYYLIVLVVQNLIVEKLLNMKWKVVYLNFSSTVRDHSRDTSQSSKFIWSNLQTKKSKKSARISLQLQAPLALAEVVGEKQSH